MASIEKRTSKEGVVSYRVKVRLKGYPIQTASFERRTDAKKWAQQTEVAIREGRHFKTREAKRHTFNELVKRYIKEVVPRKPKAGAYDHSYQLRWWADQIGDCVLADVTAALLTETRDKLANIPTVNGQRAAATVNRYLASASHAFTVAVKEWGWLEDSPMRNVSKFKEPRGRVRYLSEEERPRFLAACRESSNPYLYPVVVLALSTGARKMEICSLSWAAIDLKRDAPQIVLHETKNGERRVLPLTGHALELVRDLAKVRRIDTPLLFPSLKNPSKPMGIRAPFLRALAKAEIEDFHFHDLRHSAASYLAMDGASMAEIAEVLGHKTLQMVKRYSHLSDAHTASVVASMNAKIFG
ncbi:MAG: site-specific integrase [Gammaproteobacteria bacterium]|nr:site-specific integrase [Gammaproteobacteria bacterium]